MATKCLNILLLGLGISMLSGCSHGWYPFLYRPPVSQGNIINSQSVAQLKTGMTKDQVIRMMGEPVLETPLSPNTWHYVYTLRAKGKWLERKHVTLYFSGDRVVRVVS